MIRITTRHAVNAIKIYETLYHSKLDKPIILVNNHSPNPITVHGKVKSKKQEIIDAIDHIKSKQKKTKQEKDSLYSLETILKSM